MRARAEAERIAVGLHDAGIADARFEAELLVRQAAGLSRAAFFGGAEIDQAAVVRAAALGARRACREPAAYLLGYREFYGLDLRIEPGVLIPRPETELVVEIALAELAARPSATVVDAGTGSGCIAAAIGRWAPSARIIATDISSDALRVASSNLRRTGVRGSPVRSDLASAVGSANVVVANLPYIPTALIGSLEPEVRDWEPGLALDGGPDGLTLLRRLTDDCASRLRPGLLVLEVMAGQSGQVAAYARERGASVAVHADLAGIERVVTARWR